MAKFFFTFILFISLACALASAIGDKVPAKAKGVERDIEVVVTGMVYCQSCKSYGSWSLEAAKPIANAIVSVICKTYRNRMNYYRAFKTDKNGYFYAELKGFEMRHYILDHPLHACKVKLVSSPTGSCNLLTNVNDGLKGAALKDLDKRLVGSRYEAVVYSAGKLAFRPAQCPKTLH